MTPREARIGLTTFALLMAALSVNMLAMQGAVPGGQKARGDRSPSGQAERAKRLALSPNVDPVAVPAPVIAGAAKVIQPPVQDPDSVETIRAIQRELQLRGYETGSADGVPGLMTRAAIMTWEHDYGLALSGEASEDVLKRILLGGSSGEPPAASSVKPERRASAEAVIKTVQQTLSGLGYNTGKADGRLGDDTLRAIRDFEIDNQMPETGRISGALIGRLAKAAGNGRLPGTRP